MRRLKIAVTGGIGSGKSTILQILSAWGYPVFSCDEISHRLWTEENYLKTLSEAFPDCCTDGIIDRKKLSAHVFSDREERKRLERISHPRIMRELMEKMERENVSFAEVPLLYEGGYEQLFDGVLLVNRRESDRIASVVKRDNTDEEEVRRRIAAQLGASMRERADVVLNNDGTLEQLKAKLKTALKLFCL